MDRISCSVLSLAMGACALLPFQAANAGASNFFMPILDVTIFVPCANNGAGELVALNGKGHYTFITTTTPTSETIGTTFQWQLSGIGMLTSLKYRSNWGGQTRETFEGFPLPINFTSDNIIRVFGQGPGSNFILRSTIHKTINADGTVTAKVDNYNVSCK